MRRVFRNDPDGLRLPVKLDTTTNGEFAPIPLAAVHRLANETAMREATRHARGLGMSRREFLVSAAGTATALLAMNAAYAAAGNVGGSFMLTHDAAKDPALARRSSAAATSSSTCRATSWIRAGNGSRTRRNGARDSSASRAPRAPAWRRSSTSAPSSSSRTCSSIRTPTAWCCRSCRARSPASR